MRTAVPKLVLGAVSITLGDGGISRVARLMAKALAEEATGGRLHARILVLTGYPHDSLFGLPVRAFRGSKMKFALAVHRAALDSTHFIYDSCNTAQAHCRLPFLDRPFMTYLHGVEVWENAKPGRINAARRAAMLIANSAYTRKRAESCRGGFARARICWLGTEEDCPPPRPVPDARESPRALMVGRIDERYKGHDELLESWPQVRGTVRNAALTIVGRGKRLEAVRAKARTLPVGNSVEFCGFVSESELEKLYDSSTLFVMPSRGEGFGLVYVEAMRHELPVIASAHDAAQEIVMNGQTGYTVDLHCKGELAERLIDLLQDLDKARRLGERAQEQWAQRFSYGAFRTRFVPILREFLQK